MHRNRRPKTLLMLAPLLWSLAAPVLANCPAPGADIDLSERDAVRLAQLEQSRLRGLSASLLGESAEERSAVAAIFSDGLAPPDPGALPGRYECRTIKLGGLLPLIVYGWFRCEIGEDAGGSFSIAKVTGSQNFTGTLFPGEAGSGLIFRGASHYGDEGPRDYGDDPERDEVGCFSAAGNGHFVLELPFPVLESAHDVIEFRPL